MSKKKSPKERLINNNLWQVSRFQQKTKKRKKWIKKRKKWNLLISHLEYLKVNLCLRKLKASIRCLGKILGLQMLYNLNKEHQILFNNLNKDHHQVSIQYHNLIRVLQVLDHLLGLIKVHHNIKVLLALIMVLPALAEVVHLKTLHHLQDSPKAHLNPLYHLQAFHKEGHHHSASTKGLLTIQTSGLLPAQLTFPSSNTRSS